MAIKRVNSTGESFKFLTNQSSISHIADTNNITVNGVNVFVNKPKKGDIMCVKNGKVVWIDGLSINQDQLSSDIETVGICLKVDGNKAMVKYKYELGYIWAKANSYVLSNDIANLFNGVSHTLTIALNGGAGNDFTFTTNSYEDFNTKLNNFLKGKNNAYSSILVNNQIIINCTAFTSLTITDKTTGTKYNLTGNTAGAIDENRECYRNNGFTCEIPGYKYYAGCCRARYYDFVCFNKEYPWPDAEMTNINTVPGIDIYAAHPNDFDDLYGDGYCKILKDTFASYDEYFDSMMVKYPCGKGGVIAQFPSGKENTYKLADYTFINNVTGEESPLYPAINYAASINVNTPKLGKGNWWLPSVAEMVQMMYDVTYGTSFWETNPDIVNHVIDKFNSSGRETWDMLSPLTHMWTSSKYSSNNAYFYYAGDGNVGCIQMNIHENLIHSTPITIYEF